MLNDMSTVKAGSRLRSLVCTTEVVVVKPPADDVVLTCGDQPLVPADDARVSDGSAVAGEDGGSLLGKRYVDEDAGVELLCVKAGAGALGVDGRVLTVKGAKPLPATD